MDKLEIEIAKYWCLVCLAPLNMSYKSNIDIAGKAGEKSSLMRYD